MKTKKKFQLPHIVFLLLFLMLFMSLMTYILPTGEFVALEDGQNQYVATERAPVSPLGILPLIFQGTAGSGTIIALLLLLGGCSAMVIETKAINRLIDYLLYRLQNKGAKVLVPSVFVLFAFITAFIGEGVIGLFPVAVLFVKKLKLDPPTAAGLTIFPFVVGFASSPTTCHAAQALMGVPIYSGFFVRFINLVICVLISAVYVTRYAMRVQKDPARSIMDNSEWMNELGAGEIKELEAANLDIRDVLILALFFGQYILAVWLMLPMGMGLTALPAVMLPVGIVCGLLARKSLNEIGNAFLKGVADMSGICIIIGLASTLTLIMKTGKIMDTISYYASLPLQGLDSGFAAIGMAVIMAALNIFVPSASAKAAALIPIIKPIAENLGMSAQVAVQAFQVGDGLMNGISPFMGITFAVLASVNMDYRKWLKWFVPICVLLYVVEFVFLYVVSYIGWT